MKELIVKTITNLFKVKSIITICVMAVFTILALKSEIPNELTASVITAVITYYFTKNNNKESE